ncbi:MAG: Tyrosine recombinase XerC [Candidatus Erwinia impunctatus]|nr:Tyrosine recombinase XerC [Culicoides impunctatus]
MDGSYAVPSVNMAQSVFRGLAQTAFNLNCLEADTLARIRAVKRVNGDNQRKGSTLSREDVRALIQAAKRHAQRIRCCRDAAIVMTLCGAGLRSGERVSLERRDYDNGILTVRQGKGCKYREIYVAAPELKFTSAILRVPGSVEQTRTLMD